MTIFFNIAQVCKCISHFPSFWHVQNYYILKFVWITALERKNWLFQWTCEFSTNMDLANNLYPLIILKWLASVCEFWFIPNDILCVLKFCTFLLLDRIVFIFLVYLVQNNVQISHLLNELSGCYNHCWKMLNFYNNIFIWRQSSLSFSNLDKIKKKKKKY